MKVGDLVKCPHNFLTRETDLLAVVTDVVGRHIFLTDMRGRTDCWFKEDLEILT